MNEVEFSKLTGQGNDFILIKGDLQQLSKVELVSINGIVVLSTSSFNCTNNQLEIKTNTLVAGTYIINIYAEGTITFTQKWIKK